MSKPLVKLSLVSCVLIIVYILALRPEYVCQHLNNKIGCYQGDLDLRISFLGMDAGRDYITNLFQQRYINQGECHTLGHRLGHQSALSGNLSIEEALGGDNGFCGWAYYHGLMEGWFGREANHGSLSRDASEVCGSLDPAAYLSVFNCFHGLGHGFYYVDSDLANSLMRCDEINSDSGKGFCYDGVFMANNFELADHPAPSCPMLEDRYESYCFWRHLPMNVFLPGSSEYGIVPDSQKINSISTSLPEEFRPIFWNGIGRELDSRLASDTDKISNLCAEAGSYELDCMIGAAKHMVFYDKGDNGRALKLCSMFGDKEKIINCSDKIMLKKYPDF